MNIYQHDVYLIIWVAWLFRRSRLRLLFCVYSTQRRRYAPLGSPIGTTCSIAPCTDLTWCRLQRTWSYPIIIIVIEYRKVCNAWVVDVSIRQKFNWHGSSTYELIFCRENSFLDRNTQTAIIFRKQRDCVRILVTLTEIRWHWANTMMLKRPTQDLLRF